MANTFVTSAADRLDKLNVMLALATFKIVLFDTVPATTVAYSALSTKASYPSYADQSLASGGISSPSDDGTTCSASNTAAITFPSPSGSGTHDIEGLGVYDSAGTCRYMVTLGPAISTPTTGETIAIAIGALIFSQQ